MEDIERVGSRSRTQHTDVFLMTRKAVGVCQNTSAKDSLSPRIHLHCSTSTLAARSNAGAPRHWQLRSGIWIGHELVKGKKRFTTSLH